MTRELVRTEIRLLLREPVVLVVALLFPMLMMALLLASFGDNDSEAFLGLGGATFYVTSYLAATVAAMGFMGTPTHVAAYRAGGVLRRFRAAGVPAAGIVLSQMAVTAVLSVAGAGIMLAMAGAGWDLEAPDSAAGVVLGFADGVAAFAAAGVLLGTLLPTARAAQGLGLVLFFGTFFLVGGGPPPEDLPDGLRTVAGWTPTGLLVDAIREPWSGGGHDAAALLALAGTAAACAVLAVRRLSST